MMDSPYQYVAVAMAGVCAAYGLYRLGSLRMVERTARMMESEITSREKILLGPQYVHEYSDANWLGTKWSGSVVLTDQKLLFCPSLGRARQIPLRSITGVKESKAFAGHIRFGSCYVIMEIDDGKKYGFQLRDGSQWLAAIDRARLALNKR